MPHFAHKDYGYLGSSLAWTYQGTIYGKTDEQVCLEIMIIFADRSNVKR